MLFRSDVHTETGAHVKRIETWEHWADQIGFVPEDHLTASDGRAALDTLAKSMEAQFGAKVSLPWHQATRSRR